MNVLQLEIKDISTEKVSKDLKLNPIENILLITFNHLFH